MHPPQQKKFAQKQRRRRKRARRGPGPPSRRAPPPTGGGHPAGAAGCGAHAGASASLQHHDGSGRGVFRGARAPCSQSAKGYTFWPSSCSCAPPPLRVRAWYASPLLAPATSLSIIFIACSPLLPPLRALPRQCLAAHRLLAAPEIHRRRNVRSATALAPCAPYFTCALVASWRGPAAHAGAQTGSAPCSRKHCFPRGTRCLPLRTRALAATYAHSALCRLPRRLTCCALRPACQFATRPPAPPVPATQQAAPPPRNGTVTLPTASLRTFSS